MRPVHRAVAVLAATAAAVAVVAIVGTGTAAAIGRSGATAHAAPGAPNHKISNSTSTNWSGYAVAGGTYTTVTASWVQPAVTCSGTAYSSFWVGIDGDTSNTVEQTGTEADCSSGSPRTSPNSATSSPRRSRTAATW